MSPYEALYGRPCRTPLCWTQVGEQSIIGPDIADKTTRKIEMVRDNMKNAQDKQRHYANKNRKECEFAVGDLVYLKTVVLKGKSRITSSGKLKPRYIGPFKVVKKVGEVAYKLELPSTMNAFHSTFHVSQLRKCLGHDEEVLNETPQRLRKDLTVETEPDRILDKAVKATRNKNTTMIKVLWKNGSIEEATWETVNKMKADFPKWFEEQVRNGFEDESVLRGGDL